MRPINLHRLNPSDDWRKSAKAAEDAVASDSKKPSDLSEIWSSLKPQLAELSYGKCWYCEARQARSDNAVDHFRPKSKYPWRAFRAENFRYACTFCNSRRTDLKTGETGGKGDHFPLFENSVAATTEKEIPREQPLLLDPCVAADCLLLDFKSDGKACSADPSNPNFTRRVEASVKYYNLNHTDLAEQRRILAVELETWILNADSLYPSVEQGGDPMIANAFRTLLDSIARRLQEAAELSAFARRIVKTHRTKQWVELLVW